MTRARVPVLRKVLFIFYLPILPFVAQALLPVPRRVLFVLYLSVLSFVAQVLNLCPAGLYSFFVFPSCLL